MSELDEIWKPVVGYEGLYEVSSLGRVRSLDRDSVFANKKTGVIRRTHRGRLLTPVYDGRGLYKHVNLRKNGVAVSRNVHRLVAIAFVPNPNNLPEVNHIDEDKTNNAASNLEWCDHLYNNRYGTKLTASQGEKNAMNKFSEETVREMRMVFVPGDPEFGLMALSRKYGISPSHTCAILKRRRWGWLE